MRDAFDFFTPLLFRFYFLLLYWFDKLFKVERKFAIQVKIKDTNLAIGFTDNRHNLFIMVELTPKEAEAFKRELTTKVVCLSFKNGGNLNESSE